VVAISAAAQPSLPDKVRAQVQLAHLALQAALQALTSITNSKTTGQHHSSAVDSLTDCVTQLLQDMARRWQQAAVKASSAAAAVAAQLYVEELAAVASCCTALRGVKTLKAASSLVQQVAGEQLLQRMLHGNLPSHLGPQVSGD